MLYLIALAGCDDVQSQALQSQAIAPESELAIPLGQEAYTPVRTPSNTIINDEGLPVPAKEIKKLNDYRGYELCTPINDPAFKTARLASISGDKNTDEQIRDYLEQAITQNKTEAMVLLGDLLLLEGGEEQSERAKSLYDQAYDLGSASAAFALGLYYQSGESGTVDLDRALRYMRESADSGCVRGGIGLASVLVFMEAYDEAIPILETYADLGVPETIILLAQMHRDGKGVKRDISKYRELLDKAWKIGWPEAGYYVANHILFKKYGYNGGDEVFEQIASQVADMGHINAKGMLCSYRHQKKTANNDYRFDDIFKLCKEAADANEETALSVMSAIYYYDTSGLKDIELSKIFLKKAAESGSILMLRNLSLNLLKGKKGFKQNIDESMQWTKRGAELGYPPSMLLYGYYWSDELVDVPSVKKPDYYQCALWASVAANLVNPYHKAPKTEKDARLCKRKLEEQKPNDQALIQKLDEEISRLTESYRNSKGVLQYLHQYRTKVIRPLI